MKRTSPSVSANEMTKKKKKKSCHWNSSLMMMQSARASGNERTRRKMKKRPLQRQSRSLRDCPTMQQWLGAPCLSRVSLSCGRKTRPKRTMRRCHQMNAVWRSEKMLMLKWKAEKRRRRWTRMNMKKKKKSRRRRRHCCCAHVRVRAQCHHGCRLCMAYESGQTSEPAAAAEAPCLLCQ